MTSLRATTVGGALTALLLAMPVIAHATFALVYTIPGAVQDSKIGMAVACTNVDTVSVDWKVLFFDQDGNAIDTITAFDTLQPNSSRTWEASSSPLSDFPDDVRENLPTFSGFARVMATSLKLVCSAFVLDTTSSPPISMRSLPTVRKIKQKGD